MFLLMIGLLLTIPSQTPNAERDVQYLAQSTMIHDGVCSTSLINVKPGNLIRVAVRTRNSEETPTVSDSVGDKFESDQIVKHKYFYEQNFYTTATKDATFSVSGSSCFQIRIEEYRPH
jgi:hypothetical protein